MTQPQSKKVEEKERQINNNLIHYKYTSGIPTLRSSSHRVRHSTKKNQPNEPKPKATTTTTSSSSTTTTQQENGSESMNESITNKMKNLLLIPLENNNDNDDFGPMLPPSIRKVKQIQYDNNIYNFNKAIIDFLNNLDPTIVGTFHNSDDHNHNHQRLENFHVPIDALWKKSKRGILLAQDYLSQAMHECFFPITNNNNNKNNNNNNNSNNLVQTFDNFVTQVIIPYIKQRLIDEKIIYNNQSTKLNFYYQRPPTLRIQPGPSKSKVNCHKDKDYGHQNGELNFWIPLTDRHETGVDLYVESDEGKGDFKPLGTDVGFVSSFFGSGCSHYVNENKSEATRVSLDFRVGIEPFYDPNWSKIGTRDDHLRRRIEM